MATARAAKTALAKPCEKHRTRSLSFWPWHAVPEVAKIVFLMSEPHQARDSVNFQSRGPHNEDTNIFVMHNVQKKLGANLLTSGSVWAAFISFIIIRNSAKEMYTSILAVRRSFACQCIGLEPSEGWHNLHSRISICRL